MEVDLVEWEGAAVADIRDIRGSSNVDGRIRERLGTYRPLAAPAKT